MRNIFFFFILISAFTLSAQEVIEPCKFGQPLVDAVQDIYTPASTLGYGPARDILYSEIDNNGLDLSGIYTNFTVTLVAGEDPSQSAFQDGDGINAEHVYPQSLGAGDEPARSDLHNIFPSKVNVNASRGNCIYTEIEDSDTDSWFYLSSQLSNTPSSDIDLYSEKDEEDCGFEPRESVKGDIARAMFYFYTIYQSEANAADPNYFSSQKDILYQWHLEDPVDAVEQRRDSLINLKQGNHNPFIIDSTLVWRAYFMGDASYPEGDPECFGAITNVESVNVVDWVSVPSNFIDHTLLIYSKKNQGNIAIYDLQGRLVLSTELDFENSLNVKYLSRGIHILYIRSNDSEVALRFYKN